MSFNKLISLSNLSLAWRRLTTAKDARYKYFFRHVYEAYELSSEANIKDLRRRLKDDSFFPTTPVRIYYPKASGLQRPVTLLSLEDQIILQALANLYAEKLRNARQPLIGKAVFSNWLSRRNDSEFFMNDWQYGYKSFRKQLIQGFTDRYTWVADFDLSAFYETIPHDLLLKMLIPRGEGTKFYIDAMTWLQTWSSDEKTARHGHGIPQGPLASAFLAECIMLPVDQRMARNYRYFRYVDDIRILGKTELEIQQALVYLDILCRERGLIPNSDKTRILHVSSSEELVQDMPQIVGYLEGGSSNQLDQSEAESLVIDSVVEKGSSLEILDRSKFRFALFRAPASPKLLEKLLRLWRHNPQHVDAFVAFLENYVRVDEIVELCDELLRAKFPYDYVRGEMWKLVARMGDSSEVESLRKLAIETVKNSKKGSASRIGAYILLCYCEQKGLGAYSRWLIGEKSSIIQSIVAPYLDLDLTRGRDAAKQILKRSLPDPSLGLTRGLVAHNLSLDQLGKSKDELHPVVQNVYHAAGIIPSRTRHRVDQVGQILTHRYGITRWNKWFMLLGAEYQHALAILQQAEAYYKNHFTTWLNYQDAFNDALFRAFQKFLNIKGAAGAIPDKDPRGKLIDYGAMITHGTFASVYPMLAYHLRVIHDRRKTIPSSHPYEKHTGAKAVPLKKSEQRQLSAHLGAALNEIIRILSGVGI